MEHQILSHQQIEHKIMRIAYQIYDDLVDLLHSALTDVEDPDEQFQRLGLA